MPPWSLRIPCAAAFALACLLASPRPADAQCVQAGSTVTCSGTDTDGFDAGLDDALDVTVEADAEVSNATGDAIRLNDGSSVRVEAPTGAGPTLVRTTQDDAAAVRGEFDTTITNLGTIDVQADRAKAIDVGAASTVTHAEGATVTLTGNDGVAIDVGALSRLDNDGDVTVTGDRGTALRIGIDGDGGSNTADVVVTGTDGLGIDVGSGSDYGSSGSITIQDATATPSGTGVRLAGDNVFRNSGTIDAAIGVDLLGTDTTLFNLEEGTIRAATAIRSTTGDHAMRNDGTIVGDVLLGDGEDLFVQGVTGTIDGNVDLGAGDDVFQLGDGSSITGTLDGGSGGETLGDELALFTADPADATALALDFAAGFERLRVATGSWLLTGTGDFTGGTTIESGATLRLDGSSVGTPNGATVLNGDLEFADGSVLETIVDPTPGGRVGRLIVNGEVRATAPLDLRVETTAPLPFGQGFELIRANAFDLAGVPDFAFFSLGLAPSAGQTGLFLTRDASYASAGASSNQALLGGYLDGVLAAGPTGDLADLLLEIDTLDFDGARRAFDSLHAEAYDAHTATLLASGFALANLVGQTRPHCDRSYEYHLYGAPRIQMSPCGKRDLGVWVDGYVDFTERDSIGGQIDFDTTGGAIVLGADRTGRDWRVTGFLGTTITSIDVEGIGDGDATTFEIGALANKGFAGFRFQTIALYGIGFHDQERLVFTDAPRGTASGDFQSKRFLSHSELAYTIEVAGIEFSPIAQLEYTYVNEQGVDETGAGAANLDVDRRVTSHLRSGFGGRIAYEGLKYYWVHRLLEWTDGTYRGELTGRWLRVWKGDDRDLYASFASAPAGSGDFRSTGLGIEQAFELGGRLTFQPLEFRGVFGLGYAFQLGDGTTVHRGTLDVRIPF